MSTLQPFAAGGYRFITYQFQYCRRARLPHRARALQKSRAADRRFRCDRSLPWQHRTPADRALCLRELRSTAQFTDAGFVAFNLVSPTRPILRQDTALPPIVKKRPGFSKLPE